MQESSDGGTGAADVGVAIDTLGRYLEERVPGFGGLRPVGKFAGGQSNPTFRLDAATGTYVLRRKPPGRLLPSAHAIADRIVVLLDGRVAALGARDRVWNDPNPRIRDFIERRLPAEDSRGMDVIAHLEV